MPDPALAFLLAFLLLSPAGINELMHDSDDLSSEPDAEELASRAGIGDLDEFAECLDSEVVRLRLAEDAGLARAFQVSGTPAFVSRTSRRGGLLSNEDMLALVDGLPAG